MPGEETSVGSIIAYLRMDDSDFKRGIREASADAQKLGRSSADIKITASIGQALAEIEALKVPLEALKRESANLGIKFDGSPLQDLQKLIEGIGVAAASATSDAASGFGDLEGAASTALGAVKTELSGVTSAAGSLNSIGGGPAKIGAGLVAGFALAGPAIAASAAALTEVAGAAGVAFLAFQGIKNEMAENTALGHAFQGQFSQISDTLTGLEATAARKIAPGIFSSLQQLNQYAPQLDPIVGSLAAHLGTAASIGTGGLISGLQSLSPLLDQAGTDAERFALSFANAASSPQFKAFVAYARQELPVVERLVGDTAKALVSMGTTFAPVGDVLIKDLDGVLVILNGIDAAANKAAAATGNKGGLGAALKNTLTVINPFIVGLGKLAGGSGNLTAAQQASAAAAQAQADALQRQIALQAQVAASYDAAARGLGVTSQQAQDYAALVGITSDAVGKGAVSEQALTAAVRDVASAYDNATTSGGAYLAALSAFATSAKTSADRAALIGATLRADNGDALGYAGSMNSAAVANQALVTAFGATNAAGVTAIKQFVDLKTGAIDYQNAGAAPLIQALQGVQDANVAAASATYQHELATKGGIKAGDDAYNQYIGQTRGALIDEATHFGLTAGQAQKFVDTYMGGVNAPDIKKQIETIGGDTTEALLKRIATDLDALARGITIPIDTVFTGPRAGATPSANAAEHAIANQIPASLSAGFPPGGAAGFGQLPEGFSTIDEQGWELLHKQGSNVQVFSHSQSKKMLPQGPSVPAFAGGTNPFHGVDYSQPSDASSASSAASSAKAATNAAASLASQQANIRFSLASDVPKVLAAALGSVSAVQSAMSTLINQVHTGISKGVGTGSLVAQLQAENSQLQAAATKRATLADQVKAATDKLKADEASYNSEKSTVASAVSGVFDITDLTDSTFSPYGGQGGNGSITDVIKTLQGRAAQAGQFSGNLAKLAKSGLSPALLQQLGEAGVDGGGASASLLAGASKAQIKTVDNLFARVNASGGSAGGVIAGKLYSSTIKGDASRLGSLQAQQVANDRASAQLADRIVAGIAGLKVEVTGNAGGLEKFINAEIKKNGQRLKTAAHYFTS